MTAVPVGPPKRCFTSEIKNRDDSAMQSTLDVTFFGIGSSSEARFARFKLGGQTGKFATFGMRSHGKENRFVGQIGHSGIP
jgi:hypothetical protein